MQIIKIIAASLMMLVPFVNSYASNLKDSLSIGLNTYSDNADVQVYSPTFSVMKTLSKNLLVGFKMRVDAITAASIQNGGRPRVSDTVIGASAKSGFDDVRYAPTFLLAYEEGDNAASGGVYYSKEVDYEGKAMFLNYVRQLNSQNTAIGIGLSQSYDTWNPAILRELPKDYRNESKVDFSINQLISPTFSMQLVYSYMYSEGFLSSPYHYVIQDSFAKFENYPDKRTGHAFAIKGVTLVNDLNSMNYSYRYYTDDWDISSHTASVEWLKDFSDKFTSGLRLRYYTKTGSNFAKDVGAYAVTDQYFAADYRMSAFDSYDIGIPLTYKPSMTSDLKYSLSVDYYQTSDNAYIKSWYDTNYLQAVYTTFRIDYEF